MADATTIPAPTATPVGDDVLYEVIDGRVVEKPPMGAFEALLATKLVGLLYNSGLTDRLGQIACETLFKLGAGRDLKRRPDLAFVSYQRWPRQRQVPSGEAWEIAPDLAVEVVSPSNTAAEVVTKLGEYFRAGVRLVWVVYPEQCLVYVYRSPTDVRVLKAGDEFDGDDIIPGLRIPLTDLFGDGAEPDVGGA